MRHRVSILGAGTALLLLPQAPPPRALDMVDATDAAGLVPLDWYRWPADRCASTRAALEQDWPQ